MAPGGARRYGAAMASTFDIQSIQYFSVVPGALDTANTRQLFQDYKSLGFNTVTIGWGVAVNEKTGDFTGSFPAFSNYPATMSQPPLSEIREVAAIAQSLGLQVILKPQSQSTQASAPDNINQHTILPGFDAAKYFANWKDYISQVATLAREINAYMVVIGTENSGLDTAPYLAQWTSVINAARANYSGLLTYDAYGVVQRTYGYGVDQVPFWGLLDMIGVSAYFPLTANPNPTYADVLAGWYANRISPLDTTAPPVDLPAALRALSLQYGKPVYFSEFGGMAFKGVVNNPAGAGPDVKVPDVQQHQWLYESFLTAFANANAAAGDNWFRGMNAWAVYKGVPGSTAPHYNQYLTQGLIDFEVRGKPAATTLQEWYTGQAIAAGGANANITGGSGSKDRVVFLGRSDQYSITVNPDGVVTVTDTGTGRTSTDRLKGVEYLSFSDKTVSLAAMGLPLTLTGGTGTATLDGGAGVDTAVYSGARAGYTVTRTDTGFTVKHAAGTDTLVSVERLKFSDALVALDTAGNAGKAYRLYQAAFNRTPDQGGLGYQMKALDDGLNIAQVAANFIASPEFQRTYGALNDTQFVTQLYQNVLHRAPDAGGLSFHTNNLATGANTRANVLVGFSESPENQAALIGTIQNGMVYTL